MILSTPYPEYRRRNTFFVTSFNYEILFTDLSAIIADNYETASWYTFVDNTSKLNFCVMWNTSYSSGRVLNECFHMGMQFLTEVYLGNDTSHVILSVCTIYSPQNS